MAASNFAKAYFQNNALMVVWISALASVWNGDYGVKLNDIKDSFLLEDIKSRKWTFMASKEFKPYVIYNFEILVADGLTFEPKHFRVRCCGQRAL